MCKYCQYNNVDQIPLKLESESDRLKQQSNILARVYSNGDLDIWYSDERGIVDVETFYIKYCPICGKKLSRVSLD